MRRTLFWLALVVLALGIFGIGDMIWSTTLIGIGLVILIGWMRNPGAAEG
jgi:hypothetical protein